MIRTTCNHDRQYCILLALIEVKDLLNWGQYDFIVNNRKKRMYASGLIGLAEWAVNHSIAIEVGVRLTGVILGILRIQ